MKLINKELKASYESPTLEWDADWRGYKDYAPSPYVFNKEDGWEEVEDETDFVDKWHDLRKNPDDLPPYLHRVMVSNGPGTDTYATFRVKSGPDRDINDFLRMFLTAGPFNNVIAWREFPTFNEE